MTYSDNEAIEEELPTKPLYKLRSPKRAKNKRTLKVLVKKDTMMNMAHILNQDDSDFTDDTPTNNNDDDDKEAPKEQKKSSTCHIL